MASADTAIHREILTALDYAPLSASTLAKAVRADQPIVINHAKALERTGLVRRFQASGYTMYEPAELPTLWDAEWAVAPKQVRQGAVAAALTRIHAAAKAAVATGGFDRKDIHLTRTTLKVCEEGWKELSAHYMELLNMVDQLKREAADSDEATIDVTAILMLFEGEPLPPDPPPSHIAPPLLAEEDLSYRAFQVAEEIGTVAMENRTDWDAVVRLADELGVVGRAGQAAKERERWIAACLDQREGAGPD